MVARDINPAKPIKAMMERSRHPAAVRQSYSMTAADEFGGVIDKFYDFAEAQELEIDGITQDGEASQLEIISTMEIHCSLHMKFSISRF